MSKMYSADYKSSLEYIQNTSNGQFKPYPVGRNKNIDNNSETTSDLDLDDICTSISQVPINPLYREYFPSSEITLPETNLLMDHRFWREQIKENNMNNKQMDKENSEVSLSSTSIDTFTPNKIMKERKTEDITRWTVFLENENFFIVGRDRNGIPIRREYCRRISVLIFYDNKDTVCCLKGPSYPNPDLPFYIQEKFRVGIPPNWQNILQAWQHYINLGYPSVHKWPDPSPDPLPQKTVDVASTDLDSSCSSKATQQLRKKIAKMKVRLRAMILRDTMSGVSNNTHESLIISKSTKKKIEFNKSSVRKTNLTNNSKNMNLDRNNTSCLISKNKSIELNVHENPETELSQDLEILENNSDFGEADSLHLFVTSGHSNVNSNTSIEKQDDISDCEIFGSSKKEKKSKNDKRKIVNSVSSSLSNEVDPHRFINKKMNDITGQHCKLPVKEDSKMDLIINRLRNSESIPLGISIENDSSDLKSHSKNDKDILIKPSQIETLKMKSLKLYAHKNKLKSSNTASDTNTIVSNKKLIPASNDLTKENTTDKSIKNLTKSNKLQLETSNSNVSNSESMINTTDIENTPPKDQSTNIYIFNSSTKKYNLKPCFINIETKKSSMKNQETFPKKKLFPLELSNSENTSDEEVLTPLRSKRLMKSVKKSSDGKWLPIVESTIKSKNTSDEEVLTPRRSKRLMKSVKKSSDGEWLPIVESTIKKQNKEFITPKKSSTSILNKSMSDTPKLNTLKSNQLKRHNKHEEQIRYPITRAQRKKLQSQSKSAIIELESHTDEDVITNKNRCKHLNKSVPEKNKRKNSVTELSKTGSDELFMKSIGLNNIKLNSVNLEHENNMRKSNKIIEEIFHSSRKRGNKANLSKNEVNKSKIIENSSKTTTTLAKSVTELSETNSDELSECGKLNSINNLKHENNMRRSNKIVVERLQSSRKGTRKTNLSKNEENESKIMRNSSKTTTTLTKSATKLSKTNSDKLSECRELNSINLEHENNMRRSNKIVVKTFQSPRKGTRTTNLSKNEENESKIMGNSSKTTATLTKSATKLSKTNSDKLSECRELNSINLEHENNMRSNKIVVKTFQSPRKGTRMTNLSKNEENESKIMGNSSKTTATLTKSATKLSKTNSDKLLECRELNSINLEHENNMRRSNKIVVKTFQSSRKGTRKTNLSKNEENESKIMGNSSITTTTLTQTSHKSNENIENNETIQLNFVSSSTSSLKSSLENTSKRTNRGDDTSSPISICNNTSVSTRGRKRVATLPFWQGTRLRICNEKTIIAKKLQHIDLDSCDDTMSDTIKNSSNISLTYEKVFDNFKKPKDPIKMQMMSTFRDSISNNDSSKSKNINLSPAKRKATKKNIISTSKNTDDVNLKNCAQSPLRKRMNSSNIINSQKDINSELINYINNTEEERKKKTSKSQDIENNTKVKKILKPKQITQFKVPKPIKIRKSALPTNTKELLLPSFSKKKQTKKEADTNVPHQYNISPSKKRKMFKNEDWLQSEEYFQLLKLNESSHKFSVQFNPVTETDDEKFSEVSAVI